jgi:hypothetical protein
LFVVFPARCRCGISEIASPCCDAIRRVWQSGYDGRGVGSRGGRGGCGGGHRRRQRLSVGLNDWLLLRCVLYGRRVGDEGDGSPVRSGGDGRVEGTAAVELGKLALSLKHLKGKGGG